MRASVLGVLICCLAVLSAPARAADPDMEPFFRRLESVGLDTQTIRKLNSLVHVRYRDPNDTKEAQYSFITRKLYLPTTLKQGDSDAIRYDIDWNSLNTVVHEYAHAYDFLMSGSDSPKGSDEYLHWEARNAIKADIFLNPDEHFFGLARYPGGKSIEVVGYFMGDTIQGVFEAYDQLETYNVRFANKVVLAPGDAERLGDKIVLPGKDDEQKYFRQIANRTLGAAKMDRNALFEGKAVRWPEERAWVKQQIFAHCLGLHPAETMEKLVEKLNSLDNESIRELRKRIVAARIAAEQALDAPKKSEPRVEPDFDELRNQ